MSKSNKAEEAKAKADALAAKVSSEINDNPAQDKTAQDPYSGVVEHPEEQLESEVVEHGEPTPEFKVYDHMVKVNGKFYARGQNVPIN